MDMSPKVGAAAVGAALATILWTCLAAFVPGVHSSLGDADRGDRNGSVLHPRLPGT